MTVTVNVPDLSKLVDAAVERTEERLLLLVESNAKLAAPVDTGFYRNNIKTNFNNNEVKANAEYSAAIEYGVSGTARTPNPIMRNAAKRAQREVQIIFREEIKR